MTWRIGVATWQVCNQPLRLSLLRASQPAAAAEELARRADLDVGTLSVRVDWGEDGAFAVQHATPPPPAAFQLSLRHGGRVLCQRSAPARAPLEVAISTVGPQPGPTPPTPPWRGPIARVVTWQAGYEPGAVFVAHLRWRGGQRTLHCHAPLPPDARLNFGGLVSAACGGRVDGVSLDTTYRPSRGFGIELELRTLWPAEQCERQQLLVAEMERLSAAQPADAELFKRCARWPYS